MICEKCGKEIPENETVCSCCTAEEAVVEQTAEPAIDLKELGAPVTTVVRGKRGAARIAIGIVALVLMVATLVVSFWKPILLIGTWTVNQTIPTGVAADLQVESAMIFTPGGESVWTDTLVNYQEVGYPEDQSKIENNFTYSVDDGKLCMVLAGGEQQDEQKLEVFFSVTPQQLSYWPEAGTPRQVFDYYRSGFFYPSMYLWLAAFVLLVLGVLLLAIPGKKHEIMIREEETVEDEEVTVSIADEAEVEEVTEQVAEVVEEVAEAVEEATETTEE